MSEDDLRALPPVRGRRVLELGCGTAYWSAWLARRGARPFRLDLSDAQLAAARSLQREFGLAFPLLQATGEDVPLADESVDVVLSEYGASLWCDPERWVAEASRVLRPGGELLFLVNGTLLVLCSPDDDVNETLVLGFSVEEGGPPAGDRLLRDYFGLGRIEWKSQDAVEFHLGYGDWIRLRRRNCFEVTDLIELRAPPAAAATRFGMVTPEWARRWPSEQIWKARKRS